MLIECDEKKDVKLVSVREIIRNFIYENFLFNDYTQTLSDQESFLESGIIDSTGVLELVTFVEETFGIKIADDELIPENLDSVGQLDQFIQLKQSY